ncbi:MAG: carbohydrate ABC transporter permease [Chloroflexi bacterium]|nr:carbohydrate ABC transporter permease [Chloroflexota bacterium]
MSFAQQTTPSAALGKGANASILRPARLRRTLGRTLLYFFMTVLGITFTVPLAWVISTSLKLPGQVFIQPIQWIPAEPRWSNYLEVFKQVPFERFIFNSFYVTVLGTLGSVASSVTVGFALSRLRWPGRNIVFAVLMATLMLPGIVTLLPVFIMFKQIQWVGTFYPLWVPAWFGGAFYIFLIRQYMMTLPIELDEAARIDGASNFRILWQVIVPLCGPAIASVAIFSFLGHYNDFMGPLIYISDNSMYTLPVGLLWIQGRFGNYWHLVMAASMMSITPIIALFFVAQRYFVQGIQFTGLAGR